MNTTEADRARVLDMTPVQKRDHHDAKMQENIAIVVATENKFLLIRLVIAFTLYLATMGAYVGVFLKKEESNDTIRGLAILNPIFILVSDIVIGSLRQQTVKIRRGSRQSFIYSNTFQAFILLFNRVLLCYNKEFWLMNQAFVYFLV